MIDEHWSVEVWRRLCSWSIPGRAAMSNGWLELMMSVRQLASDPEMSMMPREVANRTAESICVIESAFTHTSRVMGCLAEYVPVEVVSSAHTPSLVKA